jgi:hypothetical protein
MGTKDGAFRLEGLCVARNGGYGGRDWPSGRGCGPRIIQHTPACVTASLGPLQIALACARSNLHPSGTMPLVIVPIRAGQDHPVQFRSAWSGPDRIQDAQTSTLGSRSSRRTSAGWSEVSRLAYGPRPKR